MDSFPFLKPFVVVTGGKRRGVRLGLTHGHAFEVGSQLGPEILSFMKLFDANFCQRDRAVAIQNLSADKKGVLRQVARELLASGLAEYKPPQISPAVRNRYSSQLNFFSIFDGATACRNIFQERLSTAKVLVLGVGGIGSHVAGALAAAGIGGLRIIDFDRVHLSNLNRQILYRESDVNRLKVDAAADALNRLNSKVRVERVCKKIMHAQDLIPCLRSVDFVVCAADFPFHYIYRWVNEVCVRRGIPWIQANSAEASGFVGPLVIPRKTACFGCIEESMRRKNPNYLAEVDDLLRYGEEVYHNKSCTLGPVIGMIGNFAALEIIKFITGFAKLSTPNCQLSLDFGSLAFGQQRFRRLKSCPVCGKPHGSS